MSVNILLPAGIHDDLAWQEQRKLAEDSIAAGKRIVWEMEWDQEFSVTDVQYFSTQALALQECGRLFPEHTDGVILYRGTACPKIEEEEKYNLWLDGREDSPFHRRFYSTTLLYEYLHRLGSFLPDTVSIIAYVDARDAGSLAEQAYLFSVERTGHLQLEIENGKLPNVRNRQEISRGVCLHENGCLESLEEVLLNLQGPYRIVPEAVLNEHWDGLEELIVLEKFLTARGRRMLQGFIAAGGMVITP